MMTCPSSTDDLYRKAYAYATKHTAHLPTTQGLGLELARYLVLADAAAGAGDLAACQGALRLWMKAWKKIGDAAKAT